MSQISHPGVPPICNTYNFVDITGGLGPSGRPIIKNKISQLGEIATRLPYIEFYTLSPHETPSLDPD